MASHNKLRRLLNINFDRAFGLDISDSSIEIAELSKAFEFSLRTYGKRELPQDVIVSGRVHDEAALASHLINLLRSLKPRVSTNKVVVSLPENQILIHHFKLDHVPKAANLRVVVETEIVKLLPISPSSMYWDIRTRSLGAGATGVIFVGINKEVADGYVRVCNKVGLEVVSFGLEPLSIARLLLDAGSALTMIVDIGSMITNISVIRGNDELDLAVSVPLGGSHMTKAIAENMRIAPEEAEKKKLTAGAPSSGMISCVKPVIEAIVTEVNKTLAYYEHAYGEVVSRVFVVGGASIPSFVSDIIKAGVPKDIETADHFRDGDVPYPFRVKSALAARSKTLPMIYTTVIGLGMIGASNEFGDINLLKVMPVSKANQLKKSAIFHVGYLSKVNALRIFLESRTMLAIASILCILSMASFGCSVYWYRLNSALEELKDIPQSKLVHEMSPAQLLYNPLSTATSTCARLTATSTEATSTCAHGIFSIFSATSTSATASATSTCSSIITASSTGKKISCSTPVAPILKKKK